MRGERIIASVLVLAFGLCYANVPIHSSQLERLNNEVKDKVYKQASVNLKNIYARIVAKNKECNVKTERRSQLCEAANCGKSNSWKYALLKVKVLGKKAVNKLKKLVGYERLKKGWRKVKKAWKILKKPLKKIGKAAKKLIKKFGRGVSTAFRRAASSVRRAIRRVKDKIRRVVRVRVRFRRIRFRRIRLRRIRFRRVRFRRIRFRFRRWGKKRSIAERSDCAICMRLDGAKDNVPLLISLVCGSNYQRVESRLMNQVERLERLMSKLEKENSNVKFVLKVEYDPKSFFFPNGQLSFKKVYVTLKTKSHIWTFRSPNPLTIGSSKHSALTKTISKKILQKYGVN